MARGGPDDDLQDYTRAMVLSDNGELFARLSGRQLLDNRGRLFFYDEFETLSAWQVSNPSHTSIQPLSWYTPTVANTFPKFLSKPKLLYFACRGVGDNPLLKYFYVKDISRFGVECIFTIPAYGYGLSRFDIGLTYQYSTTQARNCVLRYNVQPYTINRFEILTTSGVYTPIFDMNGDGNFSGWIWIKIVADFNTGKYVRLLVGNTEIDLSNYTIDTVSSWGNGRGQVSLNPGIITYTSEQFYLVDMLSLTMDEP